MINIANVVYLLYLLTVIKTSTTLIAISFTYLELLTDIKLHHFTVINVLYVSRVATVKTFETF